MKALPSTKNKIGRNDPCHCGSGEKYKKCCWETDKAKALEKDLSRHNQEPCDIGSMHMEMQAMMGQMAQIMQKKGLSVEEANEYFIGRNMDDIAVEARGLKRSAREEAEDLAYQAHSASTAKQAVLMAQRALELDPTCAEAYLVLEEALADNHIESINYYEKAITAAEKSLGKKYFVENEGHFWGLHETRSYMRAKLFMAQSLWHVRRQTEAISICWELLKLNPNDNQGVRYILFDYLLKDHRLEEIERLISIFPEDGSAHWEYNLSLYYFKKFGGSSAKAIKQLQIAYEANQFVEQYLTGKKEIPKDVPGSYSIGSKDEAVCYAHDSILPWAATSGALEWLGSANFKAPGKRHSK